MVTIAVVVDAAVVVVVAAIVKAAAVAVVVAVAAAVGGSCGDALYDAGAAGAVGTAVAPDDVDATVIWHIVTERCDEGDRWKTVKDYWLLIECRSSSTIISSSMRELG